MYTLYTDKNENFECEVSVRNASLKGSAARLVVESGAGVNYVFEGKINGQKCIIPVRRMKGLLEENDQGKMHLEIIVEDTLFKPWQSDYVVKEHSSVKVSINEHVEPSKPSVDVKVPAKGINMWIPLKEISTICEAFGITKQSCGTKKKELAQILKEYFASNPEFQPHQRSILAGLKSFLK
jgi:hypothetical protein